MRHLKRVAVLAVAVAAFLVPATTAMAVPATGYEEFTECPDKSVNAAISACIRSVTDGGHLQLGDLDIPITDPIEMVGASTDGSDFILGHFDGGHQPVPGGITGVSGLDWLVNLFPNDLLKLSAEFELVGDPGNPFNDPVTLPLQVHLISPLLADTCAIGSATNPISLNLTRGTTNPPSPNSPITGSGGTSFIDTTGGKFIFRGQDLVLVDNAFAAPAAKGCGLLGIGIIDALINAHLELPSPAGTNEAVFNTDISFAFIEAVYPPSGTEQ